MYVNGSSACFSQYFLKDFNQMPLDILSLKRNASRTIYEKIKLIFTFDIKNSKLNGGVFA